MLKLEYSCNSYKLIMFFIFFRLSNVLLQLQKPRLSSSCSGIRYVELSTSNEYLQIAQLAVYNKSGINIAYKMPTIASEVNTACRCPYSSSGAVDGQMSPKHFDDCSFSSYLSRSNFGPYWRVDLGRTYSLSKVIYYNRADSFSCRAKGYSIVFYSNKMEVVNCHTNPFTSDMVQILLGEPKSTDFGNHNQNLNEKAINKIPIFDRFDFEKNLHQKSGLSYLKLYDVTKPIQNNLRNFPRNLAKTMPYSKDTIQSLHNTPKSFKIYSSFSLTPYQSNHKNEPTNISKSEQPTGFPTAIPSTSQENIHETVDHSIISIKRVTLHEPTDLPTGQPTSQPSEQPSSYPTLLPTIHQSDRSPAHLITLTPTKAPTELPTGVPSNQPTNIPSIHQIITFHPSKDPSTIPAFPSTLLPTILPSVEMPSGQPTGNPTQQPFYYPSTLPTIEQVPTQPRSYNPSITPILHPTHVPLSLAPSFKTSTSPTISPSFPTTVSPTQLANTPSIPLSNIPTRIFTESPITNNPQSRQPNSYPTIIPTELNSIAPTTIPVYSPITQKPNFNTIIPSLRPSRISTFKPSHSPVTSHPSNTPSFVPTVNPTAFGETNPPTAIPSPGPSWNLLVYKDKKIYSREYHPLVNFTAGYKINRLFSSFVYKGHIKEGSCSDWKAFASNSLNLVVKNYYFSSIYFAFGFENFGYNIESHRNTTAICSDVQQVSSIIAAIRFKSINPLYPDTTVTCSNSIWKVYTCNNLPVVCVNSTGKCDCPGTTTFTTTSCADNCIANTASYSHLAFRVDQQILFPRLTIQDIIPDRTTISIIANISSIGTIYCWAIPHGTNLTSPLAVKQYGTKSLVLDPWHNTTVKITGLFPSTVYDTYCYTEDFVGNAMDLSNVLRTIQKISTTCCAAIMFTTFYSSIVEYTSNYSTADNNVFYLSLEKAPSVDIQIVDISVNSISCGNNDQISNGRAIATPSHFRFNKGTRILSQGFVIHGNSGCYEIIASGNGLQSAFISLLIYNTSTVVNPMISWASFSPDGSSLKVAFDAATNYGKGKIINYSSGFSCNSLLIFNGASTFTCKWMTNSLLTAYLVSKSIYTPTTGDTIQLISGILGPNCASNICSTTSSSVTINPPSTLVSPVVSLSAPNEVSVCSDIILDPTASKGYSLRDWSIVKWYVSSSDIDISSVSSYLNDFHNSTSSIINIPNELLSPGTITFSLYLRNFLGGDSYASTTVIVSDSTDIPYTTISGPTTINIYRWQILTLFAIATSSQCSQGSNATSSNELLYSWKIYEDIKYLSGLTSQSFNPRYFKLPAYSLTPMSQYTVQVTTTSLLTGSFSSASVVVYVQRSSVVAIILGGSKRVVSSFSSFILDASPSYDQDYPNDPLSYNWTCTAIYPIYGASCDIILKNKATIKIDAGVLPVSTYNFTVVVVSGAGAMGTTSTIIMVVNKNLAVATFNSVKAKYNPEDRIILGATIVGTEYLGTEWTCPECGLNLSSITLTPLSSYFTSGVYAIQLSLKPYSFQAYQSYTLQLTCSYSDSDSTSYVQAILNINAPPYQGQLTVVPVNGHALSTPFFLNTFGWIDDVSDYPISYVLKYYADIAAEAQLLKSLGELQYTRAYIGQGLSSNNYTVTCVAIASDIYGCSNSVPNEIAVLPPVSKVVLRSFMTSYLTTASQTSNSDLIMQIIAATTTSLNMATCSNAPFCKSLNRSSCDTVINTCGPCLPGYLGIAGYANSGCREPQFLIKTGDSCQLNIECISNVCKHNICVSSMKSCSNNCSHNGVCQYFDSNSVQLAKCNADNYFCKAKCRCNAESFGTDCSLTSLDYDINKSMREQMCSHLYDILESQDVSSDVFIGRAELLISSMIDLTQITDAALSNCTLSLTSTILQNPNLCATDLVYERAINALSSIVENGISLPKLLSTQISLAIDKIMIERQKIIAVREISTVVTDNLRLYSTVAYNTELPNLLNILPQSPIEIFNKIDSAKVLIGSNTIKSSSFVRISLTQSNINYRNISTDASRIKVQVLQDYPAASTTATIYMQNNRVMQYFKTFPYNSTVYCAITDYAYNISANCSSNSTVIVRCLGINAGFINIQCPTSQYIPHCLAWNGITYIQDPNCRRISYSPLNTTCVCDGSADYHARRLLGNAANGVSGIVGEFSASATIEVNAFKTTWESTANLNENSITNNYIIVSVVSILFGFFLLGFAKILTSQINTSGEKGLHSYQGESFTRKKISLKDEFEFFDSILPQEFKFRPWYANFWIKLLECHPHLAYFAPARGRRLYHTKKWLGFCFELLMFLFLDSIFSPLAAPGPSTCSAYANKHKCLQPISFDLMNSLCFWDDMHNMCLLNPPQNSFLITIIVVLLVSVCSTPFDYIIEYLIEKATSRTIREIELDAVTNREPIKIVDDSKALSSGKFSIMRSLSLSGGNRESLEFQADASNSSTQENVSIEKASDINIHDISKSRNFNYFPSLVLSPRSAARKQSNFFQSLDEISEKKASESKPVTTKEKKSTKRNIIPHNTLAAAQIVINKKIMSLTIKSPEGSMSSETEEDLDYRAAEKADIYHDLISLETLRKVDSTRLQPPVIGSISGNQEKSNINMIKSKRFRNTSMMTTQSKMMLGARLVLLQQQIDNVSPEEELNLLLLEVDRMYKTDLIEGSISTIKSLQSIATLTESVDTLAKTNITHINVLRESLLIRLRRARVRAQAMIEELGMIDNEVEQEKILFKAFLVELSQNVQRKVLFQHLFELNLEEDESSVHWLVRILCVFVMVAFFIGALFYVMLTGISLGQDVTILWLQVLGIGILQNIFLLKPLGIWFRFIAIAGIVSESVRNVTDLIYDRVPIIMRRTRGVVRHNSLFVQHFNSACRAARAFPHLQTARLLIALNDYDLPRTIPKPRRILRMVIDILFYAFVLSVLLVTLFPEVFQDAIIEACMTAFINFPIYAMTILANVNVVIPLIIIIVLLACCVARECCLRRSMYKPKKKERMSSIAYNYQIRTI